MQFRLNRATANQSRADMAIRRMQEAPKEPTLEY